MTFTRESENKRCRGAAIAGHHHVTLASTCESLSFIVSQNRYWNISNEEASAQRITMYGENPPSSINTW